MARIAYPVIPWPNTGKLSGPYHMDGNQLVGFWLPSSIASTSFSFNGATSLNVSSLTVPFAGVATSAGLISYPVSAGIYRYYGFTQDQIAAFTGVEIVQMSANSSEAANQQIQLALVPRRY